MLNNPNARKWVYVAQVILGAALVVLVATGVVDQATSDQLTGSLDRIVAGIGGLALLGGGELARRNLSPRPAVIDADGVAVITDALAAHAKPLTVSIDTTGLGNAAAAVEQARRDLEARLGDWNRGG